MVPQELPSSRLRTCVTLDLPLISCSASSWPSSPRTSLLTYDHPALLIACKTMLISLSEPLSSMPWRQPSLPSEEGSSPAKAAPLISRALSPTSRPSSLLPVSLRMSVWEPTPEARRSSLRRSSSLPVRACPRRAYPAKLKTDPFFSHYPAAQIMTIEARHSSLLNTFAGGSFQSQPFDVSLTPPSVLALASGFITGGCDVSALGLKGELLPLFPPKRRLSDLVRTSCSISRRPVLHRHHRRRLDPHLHFDRPRCALPSSNPLDSQSACTDACPSFPQSTPHRRPSARW